MNAQVRQLNVEVRGRPTPAYRWSDAAGAAKEGRAALALVRRRGDDAIGFIANPRFDEIVLLSAPAEILLRRIESQATNHHGKLVNERQRILCDISDVMPLLSATCTHELDATQSVASLVAELIEIGENVPGQP